jgi:hypothetical protein
VLDERTTQGCRRLHRRIFENAQGIRPGYHYHCRSLRVALFHDGGVVDIDAFKSWVATQGPKFKGLLTSLESFSRDSVPSLSLRDVKRWDEETFQ